ncbi:MAG: transcriptional regulator [Theionarchaea archaeon]|nr:transcriptional regulator [Theionarchaea archaeon]
MTRREDIIDILKEEEMTSEQLAYLFQTRKKSILFDLTHIKKSLQSKNEYLAMKMPRCNTCGYEFNLKTVKEPSKCPKCKSTWIEPPSYKVIS